MKTFALERPGFIATLTLRAIAAGCTFSFLFFWLGGALVESVLPAFKPFIELLRPDLDATLEVESGAHASMIRMELSAVDNIAIGSELRIPASSHLGVFRTGVGHTLVPLVVFLTALLSWPAESAGQWPVRMLCAVPVIAAILLLCAPFLLLGHFEIACIRLAERAGSSADTPALVHFMIFMETGGRLMLALAGAVPCIAIAGRYGRTKDPEDRSAAEQPIATS